MMDKVGNILVTLKLMTPSIECHIGELFISEIHNLMPNIPQSVSCSTFMQWRTLLINCWLTMTLISLDSPVPQTWCFKAFEQGLSAHHANFKSFNFSSFVVRFSRCQFQFNWITPIKQRLCLCNEKEERVWLLAGWEKWSVYSIRHNSFPLPLWRERKCFSWWFKWKLFSPELPWSDVKWIW